MPILSRRVFNMETDRYTIGQSDRGQIRATWYHRHIRKVTRIGTCSNRSGHLGVRNRNRTVITANRHFILLVGRTIRMLNEENYATRKHRLALITVDSAPLFPTAIKKYMQLVRWTKFSWSKRNNAQDTWLKKTHSSLLHKEPGIFTR